MEPACQVCGCPGAKRYYNGIACGPCRVFFYRSILVQEPPPCANGNCCTILHTNPKGYNCPACRHKKCLEIRMDPFKVGKQKRFGSKVRALSPSTVFQHMKTSHSLLIDHGPVFVPASIETISMCHRLSMNADGLSPSLTIRSTLNVPIHEILVNPTLCSSRETACFDQIAGPSNIKLEYSFAKAYCRWIVSYVDFLQSTHYFCQLNLMDQQILAQFNFTDFLLLSVLEVKLMMLRTGKTWFYVGHRFCINREMETLLAKRTIVFVKFFKDIIEPAFRELHFDEMEYLALKVIALFSLPPNMSEDGVKKVHFIRDAFIMRLAEYIHNTYPHLSGQEALFRLKKLLEIIREIKAATDASVRFYTEMTVKGYAGMAGQLSYDMHVKKF